MSLSLETEDRVSPTGSRGPSRHPLSPSTGACDAIGRATDTGTDAAPRRHPERLT
ncbi:hypothetical protein ACFUTX_10850 [Microbacterium sp. NPDC057407]|uniref:hypothetical protein n=1 Tax=Microbacterium sp. NPDC057407 TaxID=3346120 RepID=UPI00366E29F6